MTEELPGPEVRGKAYRQEQLRAIRNTLLDSQATAHISREFRAERARQDSTWGQQNHPSFRPGRTPAFLQGQMDSARKLAEHHAANGTLTWDDILMEEVHEVRATDNLVDLRAELVQVMAVAGAWIESLDRYEARNPGPRPQGMSDELAADAEAQRWEDHDQQQARKSLDDATPEEWNEAAARALGPRSPWVTPRNDGQPHDPGCRWTFSAHPGGCLDDPAVWASGPFSDAPRPTCAGCGTSGHVGPCPGTRFKVMGTVTGRLPKPLNIGTPSDTAFPQHHVMGAAGQPVSSYSGGGVRDVTEGKPRIDLMWPLGVPFEAQMLTRVGLWLERGMRKYAERNWERFHTQDALNHAKASLSRHHGMYMSGDESEDHLAAIITNALFAGTIAWKIANGWTPEGTFES